MRRKFIVAMAIIGLFSVAFFFSVRTVLEPIVTPPVPTQMVLPSLDNSAVDESAAIEVAQEATVVPPIESVPSPTDIPLSPEIATTTPVSVSIPLPAEPVTGQVVIQFDSKTTSQQQAAYIASLNGTVSQQIDALDTVVVNVPASVAAQPLPESPVVVAAEPDYYVTALIDVPTSDAYYPNQWALPVIGAPEAWLAIPDDAPTVTVAVIDSGVCVNHPDLAGRIGAGWDYIDDDAVPQDDLGHGCGVTGIIAANIDNGIGIAGVAPNAQIMPLRVLDGSGVGTYSDVAAAIVYAADHGAEIINLSLGGSNTSTTLQNAIDYAIARDVLVIAAAGNTGGSVLYPAAYAPVIAVGSVDPDLQLSSFSSRGPEIDLLAPGRDILTTTNGSSYTTMSGTSFAAPYVAGVAALEIPFDNTLTMSGGIISIGGVSIQQPTPVPTELPSGDVVQSKNLLPKVSNDLAGLLAEYQAYQAQGDVVSFASTNTFIPLSNELVVVNATSSGDPNILLADLQALGLQNGAVAGYLVSGLLPINSINSLSSLDSLQFVRPAYSMHNGGLITSQGDPAMKSDTARITYGVDGSGIMVGVLSDSYNCLGGAATDVASGDLPSGVVVLEDSCSSGTDEGRGMLQLVYDAAPGTSQAFHTAWTGIAGFATGITDLAAAGADVIVDDVFYADEPMFQDGAIAQSVDTVVAMGIPYFSSAGNQARQSYESAYRSSGIVGRWGIRHDFDPGAGVDDLQSVTIPVGGSVTIVLQWDQPFASVSGAPGSANDMDIYLYDSGGTLLTGSEESNVGNDPVEFFGYTNPGPDTNFQLAIELFSGAAPTRMKYVYNGQMTVNEFDTASPSSYGHANATGAEAVGAAAFYKTPSYGTNPPLLERFSSAGGVPILFDTSGNSIYDLRDKPEIVAPDGGNTTFFGSDSAYDADTYPNFFGTSAAAPHAAAVAALMLEYDSSLTPAEIYSYMETTAIDMGTAGFDYDNGHGLIDANAILAAIPPSFCSTVTGIPKTECEALKALYASTGGLNWTNNSGWLSDDTPCTWYGVTCSAEHVTEIQLRDNQLSGTIPDLSNLTSLEVLNLKDNQLTGSIPTLLSLSNLQYLDLGENQLSGGISDLSTLTNLGWLYLNYNQLSGSIPDLSALTSLQQLDLSHNQFTGTIPNLSTLTNLLVLYLNDNQLNDTFPDLSALTSLQLLDLGDNQLTGSIPSELVNLTALRYLQLYNNQLTGSIPPELGNLTHLEVLKLYNNGLTGSIPSEIGDLLNLEILMLDGNQLSGNIPAELGNLSNLTRLQIPANQLTGNIPPELGDLPNLEYLSLASNQLSGSIPSELGNLTSLMHLYLYDNQLSGSIPPELGNLTSLVSFYLYNNSLSGSIPPELGSLTNLTRLILYNNQLSGSIPPELGDLTSLITLWLTENDLSGSIPSELSNLSNLLFLYLGDNSLSGSIPSELGNLPKLVRLYLDDNNLSGAIPPELGDLTSLTLLDLSGNQLVGSIPPELYNLTNLLFLYLNNNRLIGEVPVEITNLVNIPDPDSDNYLDIGYNCLTATDSTVIAYLNNKNPDWNEDQFSACPTTGFISGMIYETDGTTPITGNVWIVGLDASNGDWIDDTEVNSNGTYILELPPGDYRVNASGDNLAMEFYDGAGPNYDAADWVTVDAGATTSGIDFALDPGGNISGTVTDSSGNPLENISVDVHGAWIGDCTDENGHYYLGSIPLNTPYIISAFSDGWCDNHPSGYLEEYWQEVDNEDAATPVTVYTGGQEVSGIDFTLQEGGTISGTIYEANGTTPITENAWVDVLEADTKDWVDSTGVESDGTYRITVPPGEYVIWAGAYDHVMEFYDNAGMNEDDGTPVTVLVGQDTGGIDFSLDPAGSISGVVTDENGTPLANVGVDIIDIWIGDCTDENGVYHLYDVPLNTPLIIYANGDSWCDNSPDLYPGEYWQDAVTENDATPVMIYTGGQEVSGIDFALPLGGTISGTIYEANGTTPITENAWVDVLEVDSKNWVDGADVESDGTYSVTLPPGEYVISADAYDRVWEFYDNAGLNEDDGTPVTVLSGQDTGDVDFSLDPAGSISGVVTDEGGTPLANVGVDIEDVNGLGSCTDENGVYHIYNIPLNTSYIIRAEGDSWCDNSPVLYLKEYWQEVDNRDDATPVTVQNMAEDVPNINFTLSLGGTISGTIYEANGSTPITENAWMDVLEADTKDWVDSTGVESDGSYRITLPPGEYVVYAGAYDHVTEFYDNAGPNEDNGTPVTVLAGQDTGGIDFSLDPAGSISGVVTDEGGTPLANVGVDIEEVDGLGSCTDENGVYHIYNIPLNTPYVISAEGDSWCDGGPVLYLKEYWQEVDNRDAATPVTVHNMGEDVPNINFSLALGGTISGMIYEANGVTPITENAWADALDADTGDGVNGNEVAADGSYRIVVPAGEYRVHGVAYDRALEFYNNAGPDYDNATIVTVTAGVDTPNINFSLDPAGSISGIVTDTQGHPLPDMPVGIDNSWLGDCTASDGSFRIWSVPVGMPATIFSGGDGNWCGGSDSYIREYWQEVADEDSATPVIVPAVTADVPNINFTLTLGGSISGTVRAAEDNAPVADVWLCAFDYSAAHFDEDANWNCEITQSDGTYRIDSIDPVAQRVWIFPEDRLRLFYNGSTTFDGAAPVSITPGTVHTGINFSLPLAGIITGTVYDFDGVTPLGGVTITTGDGKYPECSQEDGSYRIFVPPGTYTVMAGEGVCNSGVDFTPQYYDQTINPASAVPVTVNAAGTTVENIDFVNTAFIDLTLTKSDNLDPAKPGDRVSYSLTVTNAGLDTATDVTLTDTLPAGMAFVTADASQGTGCGESGGTVTCDLGSLPPTANAVVTIEVEIELGPAGLLTNTASVTANEVDSDESNNTASEDTTIDAPPLAPSDLTITGTSRTEVMLSWQDNSDDEDAFFIERSADGSQWTHIASVTQDQTTYTDQGLFCNTTWMYRVRAHRAADNAVSGYSDPAGATTQVCPALNAPLALSANPLSRIEIALTWQDGSPGETTRFHIERSLDGSNWMEIGTINGQLTGYQDNQLACGTTYHYQVRAYRAEDMTYSGYTNPTASATTDTCPPPVTNTIGIYRNGVWQFRDSNETGPADLRFAFGPREPGWTAVVGDWDGDGTDGIGVYKNGVWFLRNSSDSGEREISFFFNPLSPEALPVVGDWNGDDIDTVGVYRDGVWALRNTHSNGSPEIVFTFGRRGESGWLPVVGDWNGDGVDTVGLYKDGIWYLHDSLTSVDRVRGFAFGPQEAGWLPVTGDWNEDGIETIGLYKNGIWRLRNSNTTGTIDLGLNFIPGEAGWQPVASYRGGLSGLSALGLGEIWQPETPEAPPTVEPTTTPSVTETETPEITETVEVPTDEPVITEAPEVTDEPTITEVPVITETPLVTDEPTITEEPPVTEEPVITEPPPTEVPTEATEPPPPTATPEPETATPPPAAETTAEP